MDKELGVKEILNQMEIQKHQKVQKVRYLFLKIFNFYFY